ncbi:hypothetical protein [Chitinophaga sp. LS1]|uniref:hypothetical protein n=1 Tax=Chitinophaga sp. LS1 TaxID=3051176 RepID=UPI002AAA8BC0|nr:hypothetical protein [Chitinophaga sp. LS1]WPV66299.1 hypothetical protein QQL36_31365 [Chitinophaga sp. LS1]
MRKWVTKIEAIDPNDGMLKSWAGPYVDAPNKRLAQEWCNTNQGYLKVVGELVSEIPTKEDGITPDWDKRIDHDTISNN